MAQASRFPVGYGAVAMGAAALVAAAIWTVALWAPFTTPAILASPFALAAACLAAASASTLFLMVEAVAHERLVSDAFDPLAGTETDRLRINQRVLQNTLEQLPLFFAGVALIACLWPPAVAVRAALAATGVWIVSRWAFWIGYHLGPQHRIAGLIGFVQSLLVLVFALVVLGWRLAGGVGAAVAPLTIAAGEVAIFAGLRRKRPRPEGAAM